MPNVEQGRSHKDGRINTDGHADKQGKNKVVEIRGTEEQKRQKHQDKSQRSIDGAGYGLVHRIVDYLPEFLFGSIEQKIFADSIENDNGIVHRKTHNHKKSDDEVHIDFRCAKIAKNSQKSSGNRHIVK